MMIQKFWAWVVHPPVDGPRANLLIRLMAGSVFFWEGLMKFVFLNQGEGRFTKLGFPFPVFTAHFVGGLEIVGGIMLMLGLGTRLIAIPFIVEMVVAMLSTKPAHLPRHVTASASARSTADRSLGGSARDPIGVRAARELSVPPLRGPGPLVARRRAAVRGGRRSIQLGHACRPTSVPG